MSTTEREVRMIEQPGKGPSKKASGNQAGCMHSMNAEGAKGSASPVGCCAKRKATRRREQIQGPGTASARNADICEGSETMSTTEREVRIIEQPGRDPPESERQVRRLPAQHGPCLTDVEHANPQKDGRA